MKLAVKVVGFALLIAGSATMSFASPPSVPEIDAATGTNALALLAGLALVVRSRRVK